MPFSPGGSTDILARVVAPKLSAALGASIVIETHPGAASMIGTQYVARAAPDGYTLLLTNVAYTINAAVRKSTLSYSLKNFEPVTLLASQPTVLVANSALAASSVKDIIAMARQKPGELQYASAGVGSVGHLAGEIFQSATGVRLTHIPYQGGGSAQVDLISGRVMLGFLGLPPLMPYAKQGKVKLIALTDGRRSKARPDLPTLSEEGLSGYAVDNWIGLLAPAGTPSSIVARLFAETTKVMDDPEIAEKLASIGFEPWISKSPEQFTAFVLDDVEKYRHAAESAHLVVE
ncbi:MAG TPA: tripartite tricarboxylate transporter substrate binding protein [Casimicrobiaceae bacterium]|nr:tripartite tricarboxylate transporter substrate binding protein [Casimicrobiaceae bacterium]